MPDNATEWLPFARFNLLRNPFGQLTQEDRIAAAIVDTPRWLPSLVDPRRAIQFMADCGRGKSTHLLALLAQCPDGAYVYLPEDGPKPKIPHGNPLFIDEAQRMSWWQRQQSFRSGVPLVLGTHEDLSTPLGRAGYHVETVDVTTMISPDRIHRLLNRRIELGRLSSREIPNITIDCVAGLVDRFGDNIRAMEGYLYDQFQSALKDEKTIAWLNAN